MRNAYKTIIYNPFKTTKISEGKHNVEIITKIKDNKPITPANITLIVDKKEVGTVRTIGTVPVAYSSSKTLDVGIDLGSRLSFDYFDKATFKFNVKINEVNLKNYNLMLSKNTSQKHKKKEYSFIWRLLVILCILTSNVHSQNSTVVEGTVLDSISQSALPYVNILVLKNNRGTITNETGTYSIDITELNPTDTISFQFIGYKTKKITCDKLSKTPQIFLREDLMSIDEVVITSKKLEAEDIIKNVLKNKDVNYNTAFLKNKIFSRERYITDVNTIELDYKKSTIKELSEETIQDFQNKTPKHSTSYFDFLANFYVNGKDSKLKLEPIQAVELTSKDLAELENYQKLFENLFADTNGKEYWKIKSGIFGQKIDLSKDTTDIPENAYNRPLVYFKEQIKQKAKYVTFDDDDLWEFLHKTNRYNFELEGTTTVNGESVYIINFQPKKKGHFEGKVFITTDTFALLKASYQYSEGKTGKDFNFLGMGYTEANFKGSIYFEKKSDTYKLKYFSFNKTTISELTEK